MAYKQKKPKFFSSALKQTNQDFVREERKKLMEMFGTTDIDKIWEINMRSQDRENKRQPENLDITPWMEKKLPRAKRKTVIEVGPNNPNYKPSQAFLDLTKDKNKDKKKSPPTKQLSDAILGLAGPEGTHKYTSGSRSIRGRWNTDAMMGKHKKKEEANKKSSKLLTEEDTNGEDKNGLKDIKIDIPNFFSSLFSKRNKNNTKDQNDYITTDCPDFNTGPELQ